MSSFIREGTFWCNEKPLSLALLNFAKIRGFYPVLGIDGFLTYSRRELLEANARLPYNLIQGKGEVDIAFFDERVLAIGAAATTTYAFIEYMKFPPKTFDLYTRIVFADPDNVIDAYKELAGIRLRIPAPIVGKMYKTLLLVKSNARLRRLYQENRKIILLSIVPFYAPKNVLRSLTIYLNNLVKYIVMQHGIHVNDFNIFVMYPNELGDKPPDKIYFRCITCLKEHVLGEEIIIEDLIKIVGELRGCRGCRYIDICRKAFMKPSNI